MGLQTHGIELSEASSVPAILIQDEAEERKFNGSVTERKTPATRESTIPEDGDSAVKVQSDADEVNQISSSRQVGFRQLGFWINQSWNAIVLQVVSWYKIYIFHGLLRQREILPSKDGRHIDLDAARGVPLIDERTGENYISNSIRSSRYTIWTFFPYQIWFQFTKAANLYFLIIGICQLIPGLSTTGSFTTIVPLLLFLTFSVAREGYDDYRRYRLDAVENRRLARVLYGYRTEETRSQKRQPLLDFASRSWGSVKNQVSNCIVEL